MSETHLSSYEEIPYDSKPVYPTHPDCLATVGTLLGMNPAAVDRCRVLELGCASGGNLIPMALTLPESSFVGIDLSPRQIDEGVATVRALGLTNIELKPVSILDVDESWGKFDYISCHGVYSWVPPPVQAKILEICKHNLAPSGIAYISYNTFPGWHLRATVREMMSYHVKRFVEPAVRVQQARAFLNFLVESVPKKDSTYHRLLTEEADVLRPAADTYIFHEHLEDINHPVYFWEFMERAQAVGLQYLGESWYHTRLDDLSESVRSTLKGLSENLLHLEQYLDFLHNRTFRRTLLCHEQVQIDRTPSSAVLTRCHLTGLAKPQSAEPSIDSDVAEKFALDDGTTATTNDALIKATLVTLYESWPRPMPFADVWTNVSQRLPSLSAHGLGGLEHGPPLLAEAVLRCYLSNVAALHVHPPVFVLKPGERPLASPLARFQAASMSRLTNLRHRMVELGDVDRIVLTLLDGSRDRAAIVESLLAQAASKSIVFNKDGQPLEDPIGIRAMLTENLEPCLQRLGRSSLLLA